jgi:Fic/DOC family
MGLVGRYPIKPENIRSANGGAMTETGAAGKRKVRWTVIDYITEEVERQGHDTATLDGIQRVGWMLDACSMAIKSRANRVKAGRDPFPSICSIKCIGQLIERDKNKIGFRECGVRVGNRICPDSQDVPRLLERLMGNIETMRPLEFYKEFELIHPFVDGNGRTGKVLLNWLGGTLLEPIFPPSDLFGEPIRNP